MTLTDWQLDICIQLRSARLANGLSQAELAEKVGVKQGVISRLESSPSYRPSIALLEKLSVALEMPLQISFGTSRAEHEAEVEDAMKEEEIRAELAQLGRI